MRPKVLIVGAGETGSQLAKRLRDSWDVTLVDRNQQALDQPELSWCQTHAGDGTSALVLRRAGAGEIRRVVATTNDDETNLEVLRVARRDFGVEQLYASMQSAQWEEAYREVDAEVVDRHMSCSALLESRLEGRTVATNIGLGEGEIMEVEVLANSSVIGQRLADLSPRRWLVGAVYRDGALIVPHGDTVIQEGDRVLVVGEPEILSSIATHIGAGESEFPLHYGSRIVALMSAGLPDLLGEARYLLTETAASHFEVVAAPGAALSDELRACCTSAGISLQLVFGSDGTPRAQVEAAARRDVGILMVRPRPLSTWNRIGLSRSALVQLIDLVSAPVLVARGSFPYRRVVLALAELPFAMRSAQLAVDVVRVLGGRLSLCVVHQPELVVGEHLRQEMEAKAREVETLANMYHVPIDVEQQEGNPVDRVVHCSEEADLLVLPYRRRRRSGLTRPDVGQNLIHRARCSVLVMPV